VGKESAYLVVSDTSGALDSLRVEFTVREAPDEISEPAPEYKVRVEVLQRPCRIRGPGGSSFSSEAEVSSEGGQLSFAVLHPEYPVTDVEIYVSDSDIDTTVDLERLYEGTERGLLAVAVRWPSGEVLGREILLNGFNTGKISTEGMVELLAGEYKVGVNLGSDLVLDSLLLDRKAVMPINGDTGFITLQPGERNNVEFYVSSRN
jgi:hypothetical protein